eukprot:GCRY01004335.1.p1 GENE.GCRY01004335.1~~GCRY01004335.1.p1  ORF type:complete len:548 (-),score=25.18 GCRY01004335.1:244-1887(-)
MSFFKNKNCSKNNVDNSKSIAEANLPPKEEAELEEHFYDDPEFIRWHTAKVKVSPSLSLLLTPITPEDAPLIQEGLERMSDDSRFLRFCRNVNQLTPSEVFYLTHLDYRNHFAITARLLPSLLGVGVARFIRCQNEPNVAEYALTVVDKHQGHGIGRCLLQAMSAIALEKGIQYFRAYVHPSNTRVLSVLNKMHIVSVRHEELYRVDCAVPAKASLRDAPLYEVLKMAGHFVRRLPQGEIMKSDFPLTTTVSEYEKTSNTQASFLAGVQTLEEAERCSVFSPLNATPLGPIPIHNPSNPISISTTAPTHAVSVSSDMTSSTLGSHPSLALQQTSRMANEAAFSSSATDEATVSDSEDEDLWNRLTFQREHPPPLRFWTFSSSSKSMSSQTSSASTAGVSDMEEVVQACPAPSPEHSSPKGGELQTQDPLVMTTPPLRANTTSANNPSAQFLTSHSSQPKIDLLSLSRCQSTPNLRSAEWCKAKNIPLASFRTPPTSYSDSPQPQHCASVSSSMEVILQTLNCHALYSEPKDVIEPFLRTPSSSTPQR